MSRKPKVLTPEEQARSHLPRTTMITIGAEFEIQIGIHAFLFKYVSNDPPYGKWQLLETNIIGEKKRGRPKKADTVVVEQPMPILIKNNVYTAAELAGITAMTGLPFARNEEIDGVQIPVFCKPKKQVV